MARKRFPPASPHGAGRRGVEAATLVFVYGCKRARTLVGGPFTLRCCAVRATNENSTEFAVLNFTSNQIEVY